MASVRFENVSKAFGDFIAVDSINLTVENGEFVILVGPSGCGKTTTLRMLAGLEESTSGRIYIGDRDVTKVHAKNRDVAMVFQTYALYPHMTVAENLGFALKLRKLPRDETGRRVRDTAAALGLTDILSRKPKTLSGGQQQRVALGRAIIRDPAVFLFDEPLSNLDAKLRVIMRTELIKLHRRLNATMVYVTHDQVEAMTMSDRIVVMNGGRILQVGTPLEVYDDPENLFVAGFIGSPSMNLFEAEIEQQSDKIVARVGKLAFDLPLNHPARESDRVTLGIRPEFLRLNPPSPSVSVEARVDTVEHLGAEMIVDFATDGPELVGRLERDSALRHGSVVRIGVRPELVLAFDSKTGVRLRELHYVDVASDRGLAKCSSGKA